MRLSPVRRFEYIHQKRTCSYQVYSSANQATPCDSNKVWSSLCRWKNSKLTRKIPEQLINRDRSRNISFILVSPFIYDAKRSNVFCNLHLGNNNRFFPSVPVVAPVSVFVLGVAVQPDILMIAEISLHPWKADSIPNYVVAESNTARIRLYPRALWSFFVWRIGLDIEL